ncbi:MAG: acetyl-CoA carboxylase carboxyltransferase subunit beta [Verrucomicrobiae bacterium]|nr:acetyl-CoA carboxylase carboxyltransferase subunit beta [Verrucomicrobiae bacterium]
MEIPEGLYIKCKSCGEMLYAKALQENLKVCPTCNYHVALGAWERIEVTADPKTFVERDADLSPVDVLGFAGAASYVDKIRSYQEVTSLKDAVVTGLCAIEGSRTGLGVMDFSFLAASMGSVVGEKITRLIEACTKEEIPVILISASGGARMYEGMYSLMQMAKTSAALARHAQAKLPYVSVLTNPTTAGVMASYASLGDLIVAEPGAMIGFAGPRVIKETTHQELPDGFQTAEFCLEHGLIDCIIHRKELRGALASFLKYLG